MPTRLMIPLAALLAAAAVGLGAYAAHGLEGRLIAAGYKESLNERLAWFETGVRYHFYHALALAIVGLLAMGESPATGLRAAATAYVVGILLFSGSLYVMALASDQWRWLGAITPLGGLSFIVGWVVLAIATWQK